MNAMKMEQRKSLKNKKITVDTKISTEGWKEKIKEKTQKHSIK